MHDRALLSRILAYLERAEDSELNPHFRDDYRISWITVSYAARGRMQPHVAATYVVLGLHPDRVWASIIERRKAMLGVFYEEFFGVSLPPKKPVQPENKNGAGLQSRTA